MPGAGPVGRFPPRERVRKRSEYRAVQTHGRRVHTEHFVLLLYVREVDPEGPARLGIVATKKIGHAVVRNRAKRLVREAFRATRPLWPGGSDIVVIVRRDITALTPRIIAAEWLAARTHIERRLRTAQRDRDRRLEPPTGESAL